MLTVIIFGMLAFGGLCVLFFHGIIYAVPAFIGFTAGVWALNTGAGAVGATLVAAAAGGTTIGAFRFVFSMTRSLLLRTVIAAVFTVPAAVAGYSVGLGIARCSVSSDIWCHVFATTAAGIVAFVAMARLSVPDRTKLARKHAAVGSRKTEGDGLFSPDQ